MALSNTQSKASPRISVEQSLARITKREVDIRAWVQVDADGARHQAMSVHGAAPLAGLTLGVKDNVQVKGLKHENGSLVDRGNIAAKDAAVVAELRALGIVIVGKTAMPEYAFLHPTATRNPLDISRSPGGSSSGSAAAVADSHVDVALGTQTAGSIIRPAAFCGVVGYKPTHNRLSLAGVTCVSATLDTLGWLTRDVATAARVKQALLGGSEDGAEPKIGFSGTVHWAKAEAEMKHAAESFSQLMGARPVPSPSAGLDAIHATIMRFEMRRELATQRLQWLDTLTQVLRDYLLNDPVSQSEYEAAQYSLAHFDVDTLFDGCDILMTPAAPGEAVPFGSTGDPSFNRFATLLGLPTITIPFARGRNRLPLGLQLVGRRDQDDLVFSTAARCEEMASHHHGA